MPVNEPAPDDPWVYHFTHRRNLTNIMQRGLLADGDAPPLLTECGEPAIKQRRRLRKVPLEPHGVVCDYVPFYFAPRSPMLYRIVRAGVPGFHGHQCELVYLATQLSKIDGSDLTWVATDRNAVLDTAKFVTGASSLRDHIDWSLMQARMWKDTPEDGTRRERRMAELLVHGRVPFEAVSHLAVCSDRVGKELNEQHAELVKPKIVVRPKWYFLDIISSTDARGGDFQ